MHGLSPHRGVSEWEDDFPPSWEYGGEEYGALSCWSSHSRYLMDRSLRYHVSQVYLKADDVFLMLLSMLLWSRAFSKLLQYDGPEPQLTLRCLNHLNSHPWYIRISEGEY